MVVTSLPRVSIFVAMALTALFMVAMSGRFSPAMAMLTNAVDGRYRGGFMSVNSAVQQAASGCANVVAGYLVTRSATGQLVGYPRVGLLSVCCFGLTVYLAARLRAAAPHASRPGQQSADGDRGRRVDAVLPSGSHHGSGGADRGEELHRRIGN
jgi:DHA1 family inner membrane transport protein